MTPKTRDVFISYSQEDKLTADTICAALESAAIRCWIAPRDVQAGRAFSGEITRAVQASKIMVLVFSAHSNQSEQVLREVQLAVDSHLHIIQLRIEDVPASDDLKYFLGTPHWLDAVTLPIKRHLERLTNSVRALLDVDTPAPVSAPTNLAPLETKQPTAAPVPPPLPVAVTPNAKRFDPVLALVVLASVALFAGGIWLVARGLSYFSKQKGPTITQTTPAPSALPTATASDNSNSKDARIYVQRGSARWKKQDFDGALADLTRALELDPKNSDAYNIRGLVKASKHDVEGSVADFNKALELNPRNASALNNLGTVRLDRGETEAAIAYFDRSLEIDPAHVMAFISRGRARSAKGDLKGALADYDRAIELDPKNSSALDYRALCKMQTRQWEDAIVDLRKRCAIDPATQDYYRLLLWVAQSHLTDIAAGNRELAEFMDARIPTKNGDWNGQIGNFLLNKVTAVEFLNKDGASLKNDARKRSQAWMFAGMKRLSEGDKAGAIRYLQDCLAQNQKGSFEYLLARAELKSLGK
jgi:Tfp pilus assembly protein PilF